MLNHKKFCNTKKILLGIIHCNLDNIPILIVVNLFRLLSFFSIEIHHACENPKLYRNSQYNSSTLSKFILCHSNRLLSWNFHQCIKLANFERTFKHKTFLFSLFECILKYHIEIDIPHLYFQNGPKINRI